MEAILTKQYITRDKDGKLHYWVCEDSIPYKYLNKWKCGPTSKDGKWSSSLMPADLFPDISWGDDKPAEIEIKIK